MPRYVGWSGLGCAERDLIWSDWIELGGTGLDWTGLDSVGLDWIGLNWIGLD